MLALTLSFFAVALLYAMVGFGGGSSYVALLASSHAPYALIPTLSLLCNLLVVAGGSYLYARRGYLDARRAAPFLFSSVPLAFLGGAYPLRERAFLFLLAASLFLAALRILFIKNEEGATARMPRASACLAVGGALGLLSGMAGIGGGIFLSPILINLRWARAKEAAAISSFFILLNSLAGLAGQLTKGGFGCARLAPYAWLFAAVVVGGQMGSRIGTLRGLSQAWVQRATGALILFVSAQLLWRAAWI